ncbi:transglutaminase-like domain-containing protein [Ilumatobacter nonamiensis]|uniref:transglutaminase family protein n=1 Tax=Ilumatobacter nonamiensis TaxID=467093 RepID=UPI0003463BB9|nr:transglutaminase-like domain-containing protein [Ilumatobacter nonamiensis]
MSVGRFAQVMAAPDVRLDEACLAMSSAIQRPLDEIEWLAALDLLAAECPTPTLDGVVHYLFGQLGFRGNSEAYYDWRNSCLDRVITTRVGIPISLSVLMIEVARRLDIRLVGVAMPAHFLVRTVDGPERFFDPFAAGNELDRDGARELFETVTREQVPWRDSFLQPTLALPIIVRMLNNVRSIFQSRSDEMRLAIVMEMRAQIPQLAESEADEIQAATAVFN